jgi:uncharacterized protein (DUF3820 family)
MMTDNSTMPFGKYKGEKMANVPAKYLLWLHKEGKCFGELRRYIEDNMDVLQDEVEKEKVKWGGNIKAIQEVNNE